MNDKIFFIAEAWVNHNWDVNLAYKLIDIAKEAWADAVKFQTFKAEWVVTSFWKMAEYQKNNLWKEETQLDMIKKFELKFEDFWKLKEYCDKIWIMFLSSPHSWKDSVDYLESIGIKYFKFWSGDLTNIPILKYTAKYGKPIILWTGMATMDEVKLAIKSIREVWNNDIYILHCTTNYPCPYDEVNLRAMISMQKELNDVTIWYSDHTLWRQVPLMASFYGAKIIEKHFTIDKNLEWPDHIASASPEELKMIIYRIREFEKNPMTEKKLKQEIWDIYDLIMWSSEKKPNKSEEKIMTQVKKSIVLSKDLKTGHIISEDDLLMKRPMWWLEPKYYFDLIWKKINKDLSKDYQISFSDIN